MPYDMPQTEEKPATEPMAHDNKSSMTEVCVPVESLASPGEDEKMVAPEVGDPVSLYAEGKLTRIEGGNAYVSIDNVNGKPLTKDAAKTANTPEMDENADKGDDEEFNQLRSMAAMKPPM